MEIENFYPTPIGTFHIKDSLQLNKELSNYILNLKQEDNPQRSMFGGYHTKEDLLDSDNSHIKQFHKLISEKIKEYYSHITDKDIGPNTKLVSWGMIYNSGDFSKPHSHPLADLSSAYYCKVPKDLSDGEGEFVHTDPRPNSKWDINFTDTSSNQIKVKEGQGLIFPGWLDHYVTPHKSKDTRICISTNVFIDHGTFFK